LGGDDFIFISGPIMDGEPLPGLWGVTLLKALKATHPFALFFLSANGRKVPRVCEKGNEICAN